MDAIKFLQEKENMCLFYYRNCERCPFMREIINLIGAKNLFHVRTGNGKITGESVCNRICSLMPKEAVEFVFNWSIDQKEESKLDYFMNKYPNAPTDSNGIPIICAKYLGTERIECKNGKIGDCEKCWKSPLGSIEKNTCI